MKKDPPLDTNTHRCIDNEVVEMETPLRTATNMKVSIPQVWISSDLERLVGGRLDFDPEAPSRFGDVWS